MHPAPTDEPLFVALTVDVDPDANRAEAGRVDAVTARQTEARLDACFRGLGVVLDVLEERSLPATLFWEGRTLEQLAVREAGLLRRVRQNAALEHGCHGYRHEEFDGKVSGLALDMTETLAALGRAGEALSSALGVRPRAFRAPYCRLTDELTRALVEEGYTYDASLTRRPSPRWRLRPYRLEEAEPLWELALCRSTDRQGRPLSGYLWQLFEGNRPVDDYVHLISSLRQSCAGGLLQIALHPWHLFVSGAGGPLTFPGGAAPATRLKQFADQAVRLDGLAFTTAGAYLQGTLKRRGG